MFCAFMKNKICGDPTSTCEGEQGFDRKYSFVHKKNSG